MKDNQSVKPTIDLEHECIIFEVRNKSPLRLDMTKPHPTNIKRAAYVGFAQVRIVDAAAVPVADSKGNIRTAAERDEIKYNRMQALIAHYESGSELWSPRVAAVPKVDQTELIREALSRLGLKAEIIAGMDKEKLEHLGKAASCKAMIRQIQDERVKPAVDSELALEELLLQGAESDESEEAEQG